MTAPAIGTRSGRRAGQAAAGHRASGGRLRGLLAPAGQPAWARPALVALLGVTAVLYLAGLDRSGWANDFYAAAVQAGSTSWKAFFFGSFDASSFITVDKTPASLWVMELSARIFGLNYWSVLVPQALEGVACVGVLYAAVRRWFGPAAGLLAGAALALTPVAALMFRFNNPDALLVLLLTLAGLRDDAGHRVRPDPVDRAGRRPDRIRVPGQDAAGVPGAAAVRAGLPGGRAAAARPPHAAAAGRGGRGDRVGGLVGGRRHADTRPPTVLTSGGSTNDSILQLALGYNGLGRLDGNETGSVGFGGAGGAGRAAAARARRSAAPPGSGGCSAR